MDTVKMPEIPAFVAFFRLGIELSGGPGSGKNPRHQDGYHVKNHHWGGEQ
jgi:hypothetical protein